MICVDVGYLMLEFENDLTFYLLAAAGKYINRCKILDSLRIYLVYLNMLQVSNGIIYME